MNISAVIKGWVVDILGSFLGGIVFTYLAAFFFVYIDATLQEFSLYTQTDPYFYSLTVIGYFFTLLGGYVAARVACCSEFTHSFFAGAVSLITGVFLYKYVYTFLPFSYVLLAIGFTIPVAMVGGYISLKTNKDHKVWVDKPIEIKPEETKLEKSNEDRKKESKQQGKSDKKKAKEKESKDISKDTTKKAKKESKKSKAEDKGKEKNEEAKESQEKPKTEEAAETESKKDDSNPEVKEKKAAKEPDLEQEKAPKTEEAPEVDPNEAAISQDKEDVGKVEESQEENLIP
jgi:hypothetical protein